MIVDKYDYKKGSKETEFFRDSISTVDEKGKRKWIYPKQPSGKFYNWRSIVSYLLLTLLFAGPFIYLNGQPMLLFNILERKFILFGLIFLPHDFHLFVLAMITFMVFIVLFTVIYGRIFCGWICPQTIFMEMVFRKIEYWIEGSDKQQRKLNAQPWTTDKILKKTAKHGLFYAISFLIGNTFLAYIIGIEALQEIVTSPVRENFGGLSAMLAFSFVFYGVFTYMREQVCIAVCPYGRLQSVLLDQDTILVTYDFERGEPRGKKKSKKQKRQKQQLKPALKTASCKDGCASCTTGKTCPSEQITQKIEEQLKNPLLQLQQELTQPDLSPMSTPPTNALGDCIDCGLCVKVCPTGIDIRNGIQLECINCTACMDACDSVMEKLKRPTGLVRYASYNNVEAKRPFSFTRRMMAYSVVLMILIGVLGFSLIGRSDLEATILRTPGMLYQKVDAQTVSNLYNLQIVNKTLKTLPITLKVKDDLGTIKLVGNKQLTLDKQGIMKNVFFIEMPIKKLTQRKTPIEVEIYTDGKLIETTKTQFLYH